MAMTITRERDALTARVTAPAVTARAIRKTFGSGSSEVVALGGVDLVIEQGELVCLLGASGCGKSTFLNLVAGLDVATSGDVTVHTSRPAVMFQESALLPWLTAAKNIGLPLLLAGTKRSERRDRVHELLELVHLAGMGDKRPHELSGGMRQRVALARALASTTGSADDDTPPGLMLMDEPFGALDAITRDVLQAELIRVWLATRTAILFVTHDVREAVRLAQRVVLLSSRPGRVVKEWYTGGQDADALTAEITVRLREVISSHARTITNHPS